MSDRAGLSAEQLAERSGATVERLRALTAVGILQPLSRGSYRLSDVQRVKLLDALEASGISVDDIARAVTSGKLSFAFLDLLFTEPKGYSEKTYAQACAELGWTIGFVQRVHDALGLPEPQPDDRVREDDLTMFPVGNTALTVGVPEAGVMRALRMYSENLRRITEAETESFHTYVEGPLTGGGMAEAQILEIGSQISPQLREQVEGLIWWLYHRHQEHAIIEHVVGHVEEALEQAGVAPRRQTNPPAMVFLDLTGYTRLTEERGDEAAAELAASLAVLVSRESRRRGGRAVKYLGDGVMFHFPDPGEAVLCSLDLVERAPAAGMPPAHVGVHAGPVVLRDGDYFGRTVNLAARIAAKAGPGQVLVSDEAAGVAVCPGVRFEPIGPVDLKGIASPVHLSRAFRS
jgi:adenylate cyclase